MFKFLKTKPKIHKLRFFCDKIQKEEILFYIMNDKHSVKPDKEFRINLSSIETYDKAKNRKYRKVTEYGILINEL
jgi:hypothetical protein